MNKDRPEDQEHSHNDNHEAWERDNGHIQRLQVKVIRGQRLTDGETRYLAWHATNGVRGYLKRKFPTVDATRLILGYGTEVLGRDIHTENAVMEICFDIQFDFDRFKEWVLRNRRRFIL